VPETLTLDGVTFEFSGIDNTKWSGNYYVYYREVSEEPYEIHRVMVRSTDRDSIRLSARLELRKPGFTIDLETFSGGWEDETRGKGWVPGTIYSSWDECVEAIRIKYAELSKTFATLSCGPGWEARD
jgi:hypothetical protein